MDIRLLVFIKTCKNRATVYWKFSYITVGSNSSRQMVSDS